MSFQDFHFPAVLDDLGLTEQEADLYSRVTPTILSTDFASRMETARELATSINTEKAKSEFLIAPVLFELRLTLGKQFGLFSGVELKADPKIGLHGICDFLLTRNPRQFVVSTPLLAVVEAKNDNLRSGLGQCIASLVAARILNERDGLNSVLHGVVTTGTAWRFLTLHGNVVTLDTREYSLDGLDHILAILGHIIVSPA